MECKLGKKREGLKRSAVVCFEIRIMAAINYLQAAKYPLRSQIQDNFRQIAALKANLLLIKITMNISYVNITMQSKLF